MKKHYYDTMTWLFYKKSMLKFLICKLLYSTKIQRHGVKLYVKLCLHFAYSCCLFEINNCSLYIFIATSRVC